MCRNPLLADERARKRQELLAATEGLLAKVAQATTRKARRLKGKDQIGLRVGKVLGRFKMITKATPSQQRALDLLGVGVAL